MMVMVMVMVMVEDSDERCDDKWLKRIRNGTKKCS